MLKFKVLLIYIFYSIIGGVLLATNLFMGNQMFTLISLFIIVSSTGGLINMAVTLAMKTLTSKRGTGSALMGASRFLIGGLITPLVGIMGPKTILPLVIIILISQTSGIIIVHFTFKKIIKVKKRRFNNFIKF